MRADGAECAGRVEEHGHEKGANLQRVPLNVTLACHLAVGGGGQHLLQAVTKLEGKETKDG